MVSSYLIHHGYSATAEAFAKSTGEPFGEDISLTEDLTSIKNRQKILKLVMTGRMGQAIEQTIRSFRGVLENNQNLLFMLKCRQFIEMVNGSDIEVCLPLKQDTDFSNFVYTNKFFVCFISYRFNHPPHHLHHPERVRFKHLLSSQLKRIIMVHNKIIVTAK